MNISDELVIRLKHFDNVCFLLYFSFDHKFEDFICFVLDLFVREDTMYELLTGCGALPRMCDRCDVHAALTSTAALARSNSSSRD